MIATAREEGGREGKESGNAAPSCLQNILKRVEERSEREGTALDAHKELEMVSCFHQCVPGSRFPSRSLSLLTSSVTVISQHLFIYSRFMRFSFAVPKSH